MNYLRIKNKIVLRLDKGEEIIDCLSLLSKKENITAASVTGIGATDNFTVGVFNIKEKKYDTQSFNGNHEINALTGNITFVNNKPYIHVHITCTDKDFTVKGGHLLKAVISLTAEIIIDIIDVSIDRFFDDELNINRLKI